MNDQVPTGQAAPTEGAASPRFPSEVDSALDTLRALRKQLSQGVRSEQDRLDLMVDLCEAFDELDEAMTLGANLPAAWQQGRTIRTAELLDALPVGAVVVSPGRLDDCDELTDAGSWTKSEDGADGRLGREWFHWSMDYAEPASEVPLPALLVWHPDWEAR